MGGDRLFWHLFGGIWLLVGVAFIAATLGVNLFADPDALDSDTPLWIFAAAGVVCVAIGATVIVIARKAAARTRRLMQAGISLTATVTDVQRSMIEINRQTRWHVCYRYEYGGRTIDGKSSALAADAVWGFKPGDKVSIKVDPSKPDDSLFVGAAGAR